MFVRNRVKINQRIFPQMEMLKKNTDNVLGHYCTRNFHQEVNEDRYVSVRDFYKNRTVFITGCTGFVGQCLLEKLLRSCPEIGNVYIPIRAKRKMEAHQRFEQLLNKDVFSRLRSTNSDFSKKLVPLPAVLEDSNLGLSADVFRTLTDEVSIIFHVAALIKFNPSLREAILSNILVSRNAFNFGKKCKNLAAYVHVSSLYAHIDRDYVEERIYPTKWDHNQLIDLMDKPEVKSKSKEIVGTSPGTYFVTKKVAEYLTQLEGGSAPVAVVRLGQVCPAISEPAPGWMHGNGSYIPKMKLVEAGYSKCLLASRKSPQNILPVDLCANSLINIAWYIGTKQNKIQSNVQRPIEPFVVHVQDSQRNPLSAEQFVSLINRHLKQEGYSTSLFIHHSRLLLLLKSFLPVLYKLLTDRFKRRSLLCLGVHIFMLTDKGVYAIQTKNNPEQYVNLNKIMDTQKDEDKKEFPMNFDVVDWEEYTKLWLRTLKEMRLADASRNTKQCKLATKNSPLVTRTY